MTTFNYVTSDGKILDIDTKNLSEDNKAKLKDFLKKDLTLKNNLAEEEVEMEVNPVGVTDADTKEKKFDDIGTTLGFRQLYYGGRAGYHEGSGNFLYHGLANLVGLGFDNKQLEQARQGLYVDTEGRKIDPINKAALITRNKILDMKAASLKKAKELRDQTPDDFYSKLYGAFGSATVQIPTYVAAIALTKNPLVGMGATDAVVASDQGIKASIKAGAMGASMGYALGFLNQFAPITKISAMGALGFASPAETLEDRMVHGITFASLASIGPITGTKGYAEKAIDKVLDYRSKTKFLKELEKNSPSTAKELNTSIDSWNFLQARKEQIRKELNQLKKTEVRQKKEENKKKTRDKMDALVLEFKQASASQGQLKKVIDQLDSYLELQTTFVNKVNKEVSDVREPTEFRNEAVVLKTREETKVNKKTGEETTVQVKYLERKYKDLDDKLMQRIGRITLPQEFNNNPIVRKLVAEYNIFRVKNEDLVLKLLDNPKFTKTLGVTALRYGKLQPSEGGMLFRFNRLSQKEKQQLVDGTFKVEVGYNKFLVERKAFISEKLKDDNTLKAVNVKKEYKDSRFDKDDVATNAYLKELGFNQNQILAYRDIINGFEKVREYYNMQIKKTGSNTTKLPRRPNYFPHIFIGNYRVYVNNKTTGLLEQALPAATRTGAEALKTRLQKELGNEYEINVRKPEKSSYSDDAVTAFQTVSEHLFRGKKKEIGLKIKQIADELYAEQGFNRRKLKRRTAKEETVQGFLGSEGRNILGVKSSRKDVDDFNLAIKLYVEGGVKAANHMEFNFRIKQIADTPIRFDAKFGEKNTIRQLYPKATEFGLNYINNALGNALAIKTFGKKSQKPKEVIETIEEVVVGRNFKNLYTSTAALANHFYLLSLNARFALAQGIQPYQMIPHKLAHLSQLAGMNSSKALADAYITVLKVQKELVLPSEFSQKVIQEAVKNRTINDNFLREFAGEGYYKKGKFSDVKNIKGNITNLLSGRALASNMEQFSRLNATLLFAHHLKRLGANEKLSSSRAWELADKYMVRYDVAERPIIFQQLGTVGRAAGLFRTFQHNWYAQMIEAVKNADKGDRAQLIGFVGSNILTAGLIGAIGVNGADALIQLANKFKFGKPMPTLSLILLQAGLPDWLLFGVPSKLTNMDLTATLAAPSLHPSDFISFPGVEFGINIVKAAAALSLTGINSTLMATTGEPLTIPVDKGELKKQLKAITPKGIFHALIEQFVFSDDNPLQISNDNATFQREFEDWRARWFTSYSLKESKLIKYTWYGSQLRQVENLSKDSLMDYLAHNGFNLDAPLVVPQWAWDKAMELGMTPNQLLTGVQSRMKNMSQDALTKLYRGEMTPKKMEQIKYLYNLLNIKE